MQNFIEALEKCMETENWYGALFIALTLPDICAKIEYPDEKKSSAKRYTQWFDVYLKKNYETSRNAIPLSSELEALTTLIPAGIGGGRKKETFLTGSDFYALRCAYLHEGSNEITNQRKREILEKFEFVQPRKGMIFHNNLKNGRILQLQVSELANEVMLGVMNWLNDIKNDEIKMSKVNDLVCINFSSNFTF
jgi:hypothetical protein